MNEVAEYNREGREDTEIRKIVFEPNYLEYPEGSVLVKAGHTWVLCNTTVSDKVPDWLEGEGKGWITAEYNMLPASTSKRRVREGWGGRWPSGRTQEISRLIGRGLRGVTYLEKIKGNLFTIDCDVIQADGGTRTTSINGAFLSLVLAIDNLIKKGYNFELPVFKGFLGAISIGKLQDGRFLVDLNYEEDSIVEVDLNLIATEKGDIIEVQGTTEKGRLNLEELNKMIELGLKAISLITEEQKKILENVGIEYNKIIEV